MHHVCVIMAAVLVVGSSPWYIMSWLIHYPAVQWSIFWMMRFLWHMKFLQWVHWIDFLDWWTMKRSDYIMFFLVVLYMAGKHYSDSFVAYRVHWWCIVQISLLQSTDDPGHIVLVATTHLYFHPRAAHIRIIQAAICIRHIEHVLSQLHQQVCCLICCAFVVV